MLNLITSVPHLRFYSVPFSIRTTIHYIEFQLQKTQLLTCITEVRHGTVNLVMFHRNIRPNKSNVPVSLPLVSKSINKNMI